VEPPDPGYFENAIWDENAIPSSDFLIEPSKSSAHQRKEEEPI
jgi:hypothetical protein